jgi:uncharacterized protein YggE
MRRTLAYSAAALFTAAGLAAALLLSGPGSQAQSPDPGTLTLSAQATVSVPPQEAELSLGTDLLAPTAAAALAEDAQRTAAIVRALEGAGVPSRQIATAGYSLSPNTVQTGGMTVPRINGYWVNDTLQATTSDLGAVGRLIDLAVAAGANQVNGVTFTVASPLDLTNRANRAALEKAHREALILAQAAGARLGPVVRLSLEGPAGPPPVVFASLAHGPAPTILPPSSLQVTAQVTVTYQLLP